MTRLAAALIAVSGILAIAPPAHSTLNKCAAAKNLCVARKTAALLKCYQRNTKPPNGLSPAKLAACIQKARDKFDGGLNPAKGCFAKLEAKFSGNCLTTGDVAGLEARVDAFVDEVVCALDSNGGTCPPTPVPTATAPVPTVTPVCLSLGAPCAQQSQCCSSNCTSGTCVATCTDGIQNGNETDVDCGGGTCPPCYRTDGCIQNADCAATLHCVAAHCDCEPGRLDCDGSFPNGCEIDGTSDNNNCSSCGAMCVNPTTCVNGVCQ